jgi:hypothetical protein
MPVNPDSYIDKDGCLVSGELRFVRTMERQAHLLSQINEGRR